MTFGEKLQSQRRLKGMSQEELAEKLSVTRQTISKWELDQSTPELEFIARLSDIFGVSTDYLIKNDVAAENVTDKSADPMVIAKTQPESRTINAAGIALGVILSVIGIIGILTFIVLSVVKPWVYMGSGGTFTGLPGFLLGTHTVIWFVICCILTATGLIALALPALRGLKRTLRGHNHRQQ